MKKEWANIYRFKQDGFPIVGFTWFSLLDQVDWDSALRDNAGNVNPLGLYDLDRKNSPCREAYKRLIEVWRPVLDKESFGIQMYLLL